MITKFNLYNRLKIGDYVLIKTNSQDKDFYNFINNNIGKIVAIQHHPKNIWKDLESIDIDVKYYNIPKKITPWFSNEKTRKFMASQIIDFDENIDDLELRIAAKNFNL